MENSVLDLEVEVNGEETFAVNKKLICSYSSRISKLLGQSRYARGHLKVLFNDFPSGAECFEEILRFCYSNGEVDINPSNIASLYCAAYFMEMRETVLGSDNLYEKSVRFLEGIHDWSWPEVVAALKQCQHFVAMAFSSGIIDKFFNSIVSRVALPCETSPCSSFSSSSSSGFRLSCDTTSTESSKNTSLGATWWFKDLALLESTLIQILVKLMISRGMNHGILARFIFYYRKSQALYTTREEQIKTFETVIEMLDWLDIRTLSYKNLFTILTDASSLEISQRYMSRLEKIIGSELDRATLDSLLVPSPPGASYSYDVHLVLRLLQHFLSIEACTAPSNRLKKVASLIDMYLMEVAPDPCLDPSLFTDLIRAVPNSARESLDRKYASVNLYLEVHSDLSNEQKMDICSGLDYKKLSEKALSSLVPDKLPTCFQQNGILGSKRIELNTRKLDYHDESKQLKAELQLMERRAAKLEKICHQLEVQMHWMKISSFE